MRSDSRRSALRMLTPTKCAPTGVVSRRFAPVKSAPIGVAPLRLAPRRIAPASLESLGLAPVRFAPLRLAPCRVAPASLAPVKSARVRLAPVRSTPLTSAPLRSASRQFGRRATHQHYRRRRAVSAGRGQSDSCRAPYATHERPRQDAYRFSVSFLGVPTCATSVLPTRAERRGHVRLPGRAPTMQRLAAWLSLAAPASPPAGRCSARRSRMAPPSRGASAPAQPFDHRLRAAAAGVASRVSGHSLRVGSAQSLAAARRRPCRIAGSGRLAPTMPAHLRTAPARSAVAKLRYPSGPVAAPLPRARAAVSGLAYVQGYIPTGHQEGAERGARAPTILPAMMASAAYSGICEAVLIAADTVENAARHRPGALADVKAALSQLPPRSGIPSHARADGNCRVAGPERGRGAGCRPAKWAKWTRCVRRIASARSAESAADELRCRPSPPCTLRSLGEWSGTPSQPPRITAEATSSSYHR